MKTVFVVMKEVAISPISVGWPVTGFTNKKDAGDLVSDLNEVEFGSYHWIEEIEIVKQKGKK